MAWKKKVCVGATQVCNAPCRVKKVALEHSAATTAIIYNEKAGGTTKKVWTLRTLASKLTDEIDFGDKGAFFYQGCYVVPVAGTALVVYKD